MIECIFTIDYEIYGNGEGSLRELVYEPADRLMAIFRKWNERFVLFVEVAEFEIMEAQGVDQTINLVKHQVRESYKEGFEIGLHLHPQWYNALYEDGIWVLDYSEYNLCTLPRERIVKIVDRSISYLQSVLGESDFTPLSFRAGNWLFQPTQTVANVLADRGIKVDSSVFKGGLQYQHKLDYRRALRNGYHWKFTDYVDTPDPKGALLELPIYTQMVPMWEMLTTKRIGLQKRGSSTAQKGKKRLYRYLDFLRFYHPLKLDFCRMTINELTNLVDKIIQQDQKDPASFKPIVTIGHTKDLVDFETVESFLSYLEQNKIRVSTFEEVYNKCKC
ncbi:MAG: hypothetical protein A2W05_00325 [Candidatus Schekmanbacteria bacterium RBG_16_38_10]|uniref:NodB homology domain-containing protein n=1 Tax=Candidatus Schekmanbacteria bacterium RBG_16_38_10 TaxID=1817879 RepID=A0A1F7RPE1_9BACT|nr:MAG: hypothetical protein A2W05_00325 [Candidatus Schekmanbacteria bacterium RBG_16_38_10]